MKSLTRYNTTFILLLTCFGVSGCNSVFVLPDPPPVNERESISLIPGEDERKKERSYLNARAAILKAYQLLNAKRYTESLKLMSSETRDFLDFASPKKSATPPGVATLAQGKFILDKGRTVTFEPAAWLLAADISKLKDTIKGKKEQETARRKEIWAVQPDGSARKIVVIKEADSWVIHRTTIQLRKP